MLYFISILKFIKKQFEKIEKVLYGYFQFRNDTEPKRIADGKDVV